MGKELEEKGSRTELELQNEYEKYLKLYNLEQAKRDKQEQEIGLVFGEYQDDLEQLKELKEILKKKKREFVEMPTKERLVLSKLMDNKKNG